MKINFYPDNEHFQGTAKEYQLIWKEHGDSIIKALETASKMTFVENMINAIIYEGMSSSYPLRLRASYSPEVKRGTLIHELAHRLVVGNHHKTENSLEAHKLINPILYTAWLSLYGKEFAENMIKIESERAPVYKEAWDWYLNNQ